MKVNKNVQKTIFLDIETVPEHYHWEEVHSTAQELWETKTRFQRKDEISPAEFYVERSGMLAEFGKVVCISCVFYSEEKFQVQSFYGKEESIILKEFADFLGECKSAGIHRLCAHNGKEFDFPFLARRFVINEIKLPNVLQLSGKKPWEVPHYDTLEMWRFGDFKNYTSLDLLCHVLKIPSPKSDIKGSDVARVYYEEKDLDRIKKYCERDATAVLHIFKKLLQE